MTLKVQIETLTTRIATEIKALRTLINGNAVDLGSLTTTAKGNLVAAINEVAANVAGAGASINDTGISTGSVWSSSKTDSEISGRISALVAAAPGLLDTLDELAAALGDDPNFATTVTNNLALKAPIASPTFTGTPSGPTAAGGTSTTQLATTAFVQGASPVASETVVGRVELATLPEMTTGTDTTRVATVAGVRQEINTRAASSHTHTTSNITDYATATDARINALVPSATETAVGKVELATTAETTTGTDTTRAVTPAGVKAVADTKAALSHTHAQSDITGLTTALGLLAPLASPTFTGTPLAPTAAGGTNTTQVATTAFVQASNPAATETVAGHVELATTGEASTGTDTVRAVTPAGLKAVADTKAASVHTHAQSDITGLTTALGLLAPLASPALTGTPTAPTAAGGTNTTQVATTAFVQAATPVASETVQGKIEIATLTEVATGTDTARAVTPQGVAQQIATRAASTHTHAQSDITGLTTALALLATLASPTFTGVPAAPTAAGGTNTTQLATTAFVQAAVTAAAVPVASTTVQGKVELATDAETATGTDTARAITPANLRSVMGDPEFDFVATFEAGLV